jgi:hypothetical protein
LREARALVASILLGMATCVAAPTVVADPLNGAQTWGLDSVFNCGAGVPGSHIEVFSERGDSGRWTWGEMYCDQVSPDSVDGWVSRTWEIDGAPYTNVTLTITINGELCGTTTVKKQGPSPAATLPPDLGLAWAQLSCGGVAVAVYGPYR